MKIAFLNIYNGVVERGSEIFVKELATQLSFNHKVCVFQSGAKTDEFYQVKQIVSIPYANNQGLIYDFLVLVFTIKSLKRLWNERYDWLIPINGRWQVILCRIFRFLKGGNILISGHAGVGFEDKFNIVVGKPDVFIALSKDARKWAEVYTKKLEYIPNGVNISLFNIKSKPMPLSLKSPIVICVSALLPYKRVDLTIKALSKLKNVSLLLIGDGPLKKEVEKLGQNLLNGRFKLLSRVSHEDITPYYKIAKIFTLVSKNSEAFGLVYLEALASNIAVVAPDDINRREIIGNAGLFCNPENIEEYANAIQDALNIDWKDKPRIQAEKYSWDKIAKKYEEVLEKYK